MNKEKVFNKFNSLNFIAFNKCLGCSANYLNSIDIVSDS